MPDTSPIGAIRGNSSSSLAGDRRRWLEGLFDAKKRYRLCILNYMATCQSCLSSGFRLWREGGDSKIHAAYGRKNWAGVQPEKAEKGSFPGGSPPCNSRGNKRASYPVHSPHGPEHGPCRWCSHPSEWRESGYHEIQTPRHCYRLIDHRCLDGSARSALAGCSEELMQCPGG